MRLTKSGFELLDLVLVIGLESRTGELIIESGNNIGSLLFHEGRILLAFSPYTRAIGDLLVEQGRLTDAELLEALKQQRTGPHTPLGTLLLKTGKVTFRDIERMVKDQIRKAISDFSSWESLDVNFVAKDIQPFDTINLPVFEFLPPDVVRAALFFLAGLASPSAAPAPSPART